MYSLQGLAALTTLIMLMITVVAIALLSASLSANTLQWSGIVLATEQWICERDNHAVTPSHNENACADSI